MQRKRGVKRTTFLLLLCFSFLIINPCFAEDKTHYGGTLVWGICGKPTSINPLFATQGISSALGFLIFNRLVRFNEKGEAEPDLAESWKVSDDGLVYTFYLRKGVRFHDGKECTAEDVKFTFEKFKDPEVNSPFRLFYVIVKEFKAIDPYTFQVILTNPSPSFIYRLNKEIIPAHILANADIKSSSFNFHPIGTGPFKLKEWGRDDQITLEYNPDYYEGRPYLDKIIIKHYPDSRQLWRALMRQEVDLSLFLEKEDYEVVKKDSFFRAYAIAIDYYYAVVYNLKDPVLSDKTVREAIALGVDRKNLIEKVGSGYGLECNGPFYPVSIGFNPEVKGIEYEPDKAIELLHKAGWKDMNQDGVLEKDGKDLEIRMLVDKRSDLYRKITMLMRQDLQQIGIKLTVQLYDDDTKLTEEFLQKTKVQAQLKMILAGIDPDQVIEEWTSQRSEGIDNLWDYENQEVEKYFALGKITQNKQERIKIYRRLHQIIYNDQPACFLYYPFFFNVVSARVKNTDKFFTLSMPVHTMQGWYIEEES